MNAAISTFCRYFSAQQVEDSQMERFAKIFNGEKPLTIFEKLTILDVWQVLSTSLILLNFCSKLSLQVVSQVTFICSKSAIETLEKLVKYEIHN